MKNSSFVDAVSEQKNVEGTAALLVQSLLPFDGKVITFVIDCSEGDEGKPKEVTVFAKQDFDKKRFGLLQFTFCSDIANGKHEYKEGGKIRSILYMVFDGSGSTPYPAVYGSGSVNVTFDLKGGTFSADFRLKVQNNPTEPELEASGAVKNVSGLEPGKE